VTSLPANRNRNFLHHFDPHSYQRFKLNRHTLTHLGDFTLPAAHFLHIHINLVGPLPSYATFNYCPKAVDLFTCWPKAIPIQDITAGTVAHALLYGWIPRFANPQKVTTEQGRQIESDYFRSLVKLSCIQLARTTAHYSVANGLVERIQRTIETAMMC
jgi:hypothetical protein